MNTLVIATRNNKKKDELRAILRNKKIRILTLDETGKRIPPVEENGDTFSENAAKKAREVSKIADGLVLADDSGLSVLPLGGRPGVYSARFAGPKAGDKENNAKLLSMLKNVPCSKRKAVFVSVIALAQGGRLLKAVEGRCSGMILKIPKGSNGFGYDPLFVPDGYNKTFAEMTAGFKNRISHRAKALRKAKAFIERYFSGR